MATRKFKMKSSVRSATIVPKTINVEKRTVELVFTTGAKVFRAPWFDEPYWEELSLKEGEIDLSRLNNGAPLLDSHKRDSVMNQLGVVEEAWTNGKVGKARVRFSEREDVEPIFQDVVNGIIKNISIGYNVNKFKEVKAATEGKEGKTYRVLKAIDWQPYEVSTLPVGADQDASFRSESGEHEVEIEFLQESEMLTEKELRELKAKMKQEVLDDLKREADEKAEQEAKDKAKREADDKAKADAAASASEGAEPPKEDGNSRTLDILEAVETAGFDVKYGRELIESKKSVSEVRKLIINKLAKRETEEGTETHNQVHVGDDLTEKSRKEGIVDIILHRANPSEYEVSEQARSFVGMNMIDIARYHLEKKGLRIMGLSRAEIATRALSTSDFPFLLANVAGKSLRKGYDILPRTFQAWATRATLPDFKNKDAIVYGEAPSLEKVVEGGEYQSGSISEAKESYSLSKYGKILPYTFEMMINDDLDSLSKLPRKFGASSARLESQIVYNILLNNDNMSDGTPLFHGDHGNLGTPAAITETSLGELEQLIRDQKGLDKLDYLDLIPAFLITGSAKKVEAQKILSAVVSTKVSDVNVFAGSLKQIVEPRITGNKWLVICEPSQIDTVEYGYLEGFNGPELTTQQGFEVDGIKLKAKHIFAAKAIDWKGMTYNAGA